jgi:hypothetical protein
VLHKELELELHKELQLHKELVLELHRSKHLQQQERCRTSCVHEDEREDLLA